MALLHVQVRFPVDRAPEDKRKEKIVSSSFDKSILKEKPYWQYWYTDNKSVSVVVSQHRPTFAKPVNHSGIKPNIDFFFLLPSVLFLIEQKSCCYKDHSSSASLAGANNIEKQTEEKYKEKAEDKAFYWRSEHTS